MFANKYNHKQFNQDEAAHKTFAFAMDATNMTNCETPEIFNYCSGSLEVYYCEDRLFLVRCLQCRKAALVIADNPRKAACKTFGG